MKLFLEDDSPFLSRLEWKKVFLSISIITFLLYVVAMIFSLNGSDIFIMKYQNDSMNKIQNFLQEHKLYSLISCSFLTIEFAINISFVSNKITKIWYPIGFYIFYIAIAFAFPTIPSIFYSVGTILLYTLIPIIESLIVEKRFTKKSLVILLRSLIGTVIGLGIQVMIYVIKAGYFSTENHIMNLSAHFIYAIEYDIALSVFLFTVALFIDKGKGDGKLWVTFHSQSGSSQTSKTKSQRLLLKKNLSKRQRTKLFWLWVRLYVIQVIGFALIMVLPFLMGKVFEFLVMYLAFAVTRYLLGFKYSLHFKNEIICITVGAVVFGILTLAVPFFFVEIIIAVLLGSGLAILLHLSYRYKGFWLFAKMAKPDKFACLYVLFDGDLSENYILRTCKYKGLDEETSKIVCEYMDGYKLSYISFRYNYSMKTIDRKLTEAIKKLNK